MVSLLSGEWILQGGQRPNGGAVVVLRSIWVTSWIMLAVLIAWNMLRLGSTCKVTGSTWAADLIAIGPWSSVVFGGTYLAFYSRFSSQWSYLANLYNQIKQSEVMGVCNANALAQWKAGYIEDALDLHLASKPSVAGVIQAWSLSPNGDVRDAFLKYTPSGDTKWDRVLNLSRIAVLRGL